MSQSGDKLKPSDFVHLHNHSQYSLLDGLTKLQPLMERVKQLGMDSIGLTDHGTLSGAIEFYKEARAKNLKPIIGMEAYVAPRRLVDKDPLRDRQYYHLTMLAMNNQGYQNLMKLSTAANLEGFYYRPRIDHRLIEKYSQGIIVLSGCIGGEVSDALRQDQYAQAKKIAKWYKNLFSDRYYIELQDHGHPQHPTAWKEQDKVNNQLQKLAEELDIPAVVTCDAHYLKKDDQEAHEILLCIQTGSYLSEENRFSLKEFELHVADPKDVIKRWGKQPELILNSRKIAERCKVEVELGEILIPQFPTPEGESEKSLLEKLVWQGLAWRYGKKTREQAAKLTIPQTQKLLPLEIIKRARYELGVVEKMGFNGIFLIAADFINWGKDKAIVFGPGRGSAASSIISYALRITEIDPLKYDLLFERFLNPDRISLPDLDIDIQDNRRDEVINYCIEKYGRDKVANIVTFGRMAARNSVRDVARVLQVPYAEADRLAKMIPQPVQGRHTPLAIHLQDVPELKLENETNPDSAKVFDLAVKLEGTIRNHGVHAAGVIIAPDNIVKFAPLEMAQKGVIATQYSLGPVEELGFLKIDFLGLSNLTIIKNALRIIKKVYGKDIDIGQISLEDKKTYQLLQKGETIGVFQLESAGMKRYLKELQPTVFEDIIAMVALYRPGPMQWIEDFIARKHGRRQIQYLHPAMKAALENTYGVIVYQEQVMQISKDLSGFSGGQADTLRKGIAKKIPQILAKMKVQFIEGAVRHSKMDRGVMERFWQQLEDFAAYCFNKVHSACYAQIAYQTAYLKANYPSAFMAALMTSDCHNTDRLAIEITECKNLGIEVLPPDVNESFHEFAIVPKTNQIRFGLDAVKNVGSGAVEEILRARETCGGKFKSLEEFLKSVDIHVVNRKSIESLIKAGALDRFGERGLLISNLEKILTYSAHAQKAGAIGQVDLFGSAIGSDMGLKLVLQEDLPEINLNEQLNWERQLLGIYLSHHPLEKFEAFLNEHATPLRDVLTTSLNQAVVVGGVVVSLREIMTKNGSKMAFVQLADLTGEIELVVFPKSYQKQADIWQRDKVILDRGRVSSGRQGGSNVEEAVKVVVEQADIIAPKSQPLLSKEAAGSYRAKGNSTARRTPNNGLSLSQRLYIRLENSADQPLLLSLKQKLDSHRGETEVVLVTGPSASKQVIKLPQTISINEASLRDLAAIFGSTNVVVR